MLSTLRKILYSKLRFLMSFYHFIWALVGALIYGLSTRKIFVIGVTGTKGKTTTLELINAILEAAGKKTALISSLRIKIGEESQRNLTGNSMPGRLFLRKFLKTAAKEGCDYVLVEVTSEGVVLSRHRFINWKIGVITNLAPEHIESHGSFEKYRQAKLSFLRYVTKKGGTVFLNRNDRFFDFFKNNLEKDLLVIYSSNKSLIKNLKNINPFFEADFILENAAAAMAVANFLEIDEKTIEFGLRSFGGVPGRLEFVQYEPFKVVIDYAHTPDSLEAVYKFLKGKWAEKTQSKQSRLICVFGAAGGGRDKWKRPEMGKIAATYCDEIILTNEDPYDENPLDILEQISNGFLKIKESKFTEPNSYWKILDRREAIKKAISLAKEGDVVVLTGKGSEFCIHEKNNRKIPWNEREEVEKILKIKDN